MNFADLIALSMWPVLAVFTLLGWRIGKLKDPNRKRALTTGYGVLLGVIGVAYLILAIALNDNTHGFALNFSILLSLVGLYYLAFALIVAIMPSTLPWWKRCAAIFFQLLFALLFLSMGGYTIYFDYLNRTVAEGEVIDRFIWRSAKGYSYPAIHFRDKDTKQLQRVYVLKDQYEELRSGDKIRVEIGHFSRNIFKLQRLGNSIK